MNLLLAIILLLSLHLISIQSISNHAGKQNWQKGVRWWNLANSLEFRDNLVSPSSHIFIKPTMQPLTRKQRRLVKRNPGSIVAVAKGARMAIEECQWQFRSRRWNCPTSDASHGGSVFGDILTTGSREASFVYAITAAAVAHTIARSCSEGSVYTCSCGLQVNDVDDPERNGLDWEWGGCSDNVRFGNKFSRDFVDVVEKGHDLRYMMNMHNNEAGRRHVRAEMHQQCKCHGMSGSCTTKTCWMSLSPFRLVGNRLKDKFDGATKVYMGNAGSPSRSQNRRSSTRRSGTTRRNAMIRSRLLPVNVDHKPPGRRDLVYYETSPSFCEPNTSISFDGTRGRSCNASSIGVDGCDLMCCGRGYQTEMYQALERCFCQFHWCCEVTCKICKRTRMKYTCL